MCTTFRGHLKLHHVLHLGHGEGAEVLHGVVGEIVELQEAVHLRVFVLHQVTEENEESFEHLVALLLVLADHLQLLLVQQS